MVLENISHILALLASMYGALNFIAYVPQFAKIMIRKSAKDVSLLTFLLFATGSLTWLLYGISINNEPVIFMNILSLIGSVAVAGAYIRYEGKNLKNVLKVIKR